MVVVGGFQSVVRRDRLQGDNSLQEMAFATEGNGAWNLSHKKQFTASLMESCGASAQKQDCHKPLFTPPPPTMENMINKRFKEQTHSSNDAFIFLCDEFILCRC